MGNLDAHRGRQTISHRAEAARGHPAVRLVEFEELSGPHLVLANLGRDVDVASAGQRIKPLYRILRLDQIESALVETQAVTGPPTLDCSPPFAAGGVIPRARSRRADRA